MRTLKFTNDDLSKKRFEVLFHGLFIQGNQNPQKGLTVLRREISLLNKIELISKPCECGKTVAGSTEPDRELDFKDGETLSFVIDDQEFDLLYDYVGKVPWSLGSPSRIALEALDWIANPYVGSPS